ncbi:DUF1702 family protein [Sinorhizobium medicae]|nr:DUF1702 family protein [Sinorhizobium medicae]
MSSFALNSNSPRDWRTRFDLTAFLTLSPDQASFDVRGFRASSAVAREELEAVGKTFITGYNAAVRTDSLDGILRILADIPAQRRGFAAEGAAMGTAIIDAVPFRTPRLPQLMVLLERDFTYLVHVGAGWALARVPWRKRHILSPLNPLYRWLAFDGLGFHDCYFKASHVLDNWRREQFGYAARAYDQGVGRALWFAGGGSATWSADRIRGLAAERQGDLFSGLGLAMAYAGPTTTEDVRHALELAGRDAPHLAQGIAFACEARARATFVPQATHTAAQALGFEAPALAALVREARESLSEQEGEARYEAWRRVVSNAMAQSRGGRE